MGPLLLANLLELNETQEGLIYAALRIADEQGGDQFFGEPSLELRDLMQTDFSGNGVISLLNATRLTQSSFVSTPHFYFGFFQNCLSSYPNREIQISQ